MNQFRQHWTRLRGSREGGSSILVRGLSGAEVDEASGGDAADELFAGLTCSNEHLDAGCTCPELDSPRWCHPEGDPSVRPGRGFGRGGRRAERECDDEDQCSLDGVVTAGGGGGGGRGWL